MIPAPEMRYSSCWDSSESTWCHLGSKRPRRQKKHDVMRFLYLGIVGRAKLQVGEL